MNSILKQAFTESIVKIIHEMAQIEIKLDGDFFLEEKDIESLGVSTIVSFSGKVKGRLLLDMDFEFALSLAENIYDEKYTDVRNDLVLAAISELSNTISGTAITIINNNTALSLRLSPPIIFTGTSAIISIPKISSISARYRSTCGKLKANIAFEGDE